MPNHRAWMGWVLASGLSFLVPARAAEVDLLGIRVVLPFEYTVLGADDVRRSGQILSATQRYRVRVRNAAGQEQDAQLLVTYSAPERVSNEAMEELAEEDSTEAAARPGVREAGDFRIDGFPFHFIDGPIDSEDLPQRMSITGIVNGAHYRFSVLAPDRQLLTEELARRMKGARLDYAGLLKIKSEFEEEARISVQDGVLDTPLERLRLDDASQARLTASHVETDASGTPVYRSRAFSIFKAGFWTLQNLSLMVGCGRADSFIEEDPRDFLAMTTEAGEEDRAERYTKVSAPQPTTMLGLPAQTATAKGIKVNALRSTDVRRWLLQHEGTVYRIGIERLNGSPVEKSLAAQLQSGAPMCQLGLQFGTRKLQ